MSDLQNNEKRISPNKKPTKNQHGIRTVPVVQIAGWYTIQVRYCGS